MSILELHLESLNHRVDGRRNQYFRKVNQETYIHRQVSLVGGQLSVPSRFAAVYTWLTASVTSGRGDPALLSWIDPVLGNLGSPLLVGLGSTGTVRCRQTCPALAKFDKQASLGTGCCALP